MMRERRYCQVDVFSSTPYKGNPLAVILDAEGLSDQEMQAIARWTNLSETTFILPPVDDNADYRVRIFTPKGELSFAGHPTLGSAQSWLHFGAKPKSSDRIIQECKAGLIEIKRDGERLAFAAPPLIKTGELDAQTLRTIVDALNISPEQVVAHQWIDNGPGWAAVMLSTVEEVLAINPDPVKISGPMVGVVALYEEGSAYEYEVRGFGNAFEDPATGSLNASLAQWLIGTGKVPRSYVASQGARLQRAGEIYIDTDEHGTIWVGGYVNVCFSGVAQA